MSVSYVTLTTSYQSFCLNHKGSVYVIAVISYSLAFYATDVVDNDNVVTALSDQTQISIALIDTVKNPLIELMVSVKDGI